MHLKKIVLLIVFTAVISIIIFWTGPTSKPGLQAPPTSSRLAELLSDQGLQGYARVLEDHEFVFPADHGPHPDYRNEWWYVTGNLDSDNGNRFGFELTIFRFSLIPPGAGSPEDVSAWRSNQV